MGRAISCDMLSLDPETSNPRLERQLSQTLQSATLVGLGGTHGLKQEDQELEISLDSTNSISKK